MVDPNRALFESVVRLLGPLLDEIAAEIRSLLDDQDFLDALPGFLLPDPASQARRRMLEGRLQAISRAVG